MSRKYIFIGIFAVIVLAVYGLYISEGNLTGFSVHDGLRFGNLPISYSFENFGRFGEKECADFQVRRVRTAFEEIENSTGEVVNFEEVDESGDISVSCFKRFRRIGWFWLVGEGVKNSVGNGVINSAEIRFYDHFNCGTYPDVEIHELLHVFGFEHDDNKESIMYKEQVRCDYGRIDEDIVEKLIEIYG